MHDPRKSFIRVNFLEGAGGGVQPSGRWSVSSEFSKTMMHLSSCMQMQRGHLVELSLPAGQVEAAVGTAKENVMVRNESTTPLPSSRRGHASSTHSLQEPQTPWL